MTSCPGIRVQLHKSMEELDPPPPPPRYVSLRSRSDSETCQTGRSSRAFNLNETLRLVEPNTELLVMCGQSHASKKCFTARNAGVTLLS